MPNEVAAIVASARLSRTSARGRRHRLAARASRKPALHEEQLPVQWTCLDAATAASEISGMESITTHTDWPQPATVTPLRTVLRTVT